MKNIVFLSSDLNIEYGLTILQGISNFFKDKEDTHLILSQVNSNNDTRGTFIYQYSSAISMLCAKDIDAYIILSTSFGSFLNELIEIIRKHNDAPILSIGVELPYNNCYSTVCDTREIYKELVGHLIKEHNCKKIGFFSANETGSTEAEERFESYKEALKHNGLEYNSEYVLHSNFTRYRTKQVIAEKFKSKADIPFDSIICANDLTASGCIEGFSELGVSIPKELKIIGFDDSSHASLSNPSISTVNQQMLEQWFMAAQLIYNKLCGKEIYKKTDIQLSPVYRQSCGCIKLSNNNYVYKDKDGKLIKQAQDYREFIKNYYDKIRDSRNIYVIFDFIHSNDTLDNFINDIDSLLTYTRFKGLAFSIYDTPIEWHAGETFSLPDQVKLVTLREQANDIKIINPENAYYNPKDSILPKELENIPGFFILQPIFNCHTNYGYFLCHFEDPKLEIYNIFMKIINQAIAQATQYTLTLEKNKKLELEKADLQRTNSNLSMQSKTDELTKILNRRGFMKYGQKFINLCISMHTTGIVFFADLDGLKKINDKHGHKMGDLAIQLAANALKATFRKSDIVGRLSGDEFAIIASDMSISHLDLIRHNLDNCCKELQEENNLPFILSISLGGTEYTNDSSSLKELLVKADKSLYEQKKAHHKQFENNL